MTAALEMTDEIWPLWLLSSLFCLCQQDQYEYKEFVQLQQFELDPNIIKDKVRHFINELFC